VVSKVWAHIRNNNLQNPANKREILADDKLKKVFGKDSCTMFEMNKHLSAHLK
jgi:upstream activation factor subunit UAF30